MSIRYIDEEYIVDGDMSAAITGPWIRTHGFDSIGFVLSWDSDTARDHSSIAYIEGTKDTGLGTVAILSYGNFDIYDAGQTVRAAGPMYTANYEHFLPEYVRLKVPLTEGVTPSSTLQVTAMGR